MLLIRPATAHDVPFITDIYNDAVLNTTATFDTEIKTLDDRLAWYESHDENHPVICAEVDGKVAGFASLSPWSDRCAYRLTSEVSVYVAPGFRGIGIGKRLLEQLVFHAEKTGMHYLLARITEGNEASLHLHAQYGFRHVGVMTQVGYKFGKFLNVHLMEKVFFNNPAKD
jgi:phosphinothricin acetyltransferase